MLAKQNNTLLLSAGLGISLLAIYFWSKRKQGIFKKWKHVGYLGDIFFYPVKSGTAVNVKEGKCEVLGLKQGEFRDRIFMMTDMNGNCMSGRMNPSLTKIKPEIVNDSVLVLRADELNDFVINLNKLDKSTITQCVIWNDKINVVDCGEEAAKWVSRAVLNEETGLKLVYYPDTKSKRTLRKKFTVYSNMSPTDCGAFADGSSYMIASDSTLQDLNSHLENNTVTINQFRPNFVVKGSDPFDEDNWKMVKIGSDATFKVVLPCNRCNFVNVDPTTSKSHEKNEPLETLKSYRQVSDKNLRKIIGNSPKMGMQMTLSSPGYVKIGDPIYIAY